MEAARLQAIIEADTSKAEDHIKSFGGKVSEAGGHVGSFIKSVAGIAGGMAVWSLASTGISLVKDQLVDMVKSGMDANAVAAQTAAVLKSTHGAAGVTADSVEKLSTQLMNLTGVDDDTVTSTQNMLLTFTNIGAKGGVFDQATKTALDMSTALGQDTKSSAIQLGKALNDPITGITALQRVGVTFSQTQKDQIKNFMDAGNVAGAQGVILKELNKEFGGSAEAAGKANGGIKILTAQFDNMKKTIGQAVIPILNGLMSAVLPIISGLAADLPGALKTAGSWLSFFWGMAKQVGETFMTAFSPALNAVRDALSSVGKQINGLDFSSFLGVLKQLASLFGLTLRNAVAGAATAFKSIDFGKLLDGATNLAGGVLNLANGFMVNVLPAVKQFAGFVLTQVIPTIGQLAQWFQTKILPAIMQFAGFVMTNVVPALENLFTWAKKNVLPVIEQLAQVFVTSVIPAVEGIWSHIQQSLIPALENLWNKLSPVLIPALQLVGFVLQNVVGPALGFVIGLVSVLIDLVAGLLDKIGGLLGKLGDFKDLIGNGLGKVGDFLGGGSGANTAGYASGTAFASGGPTLVGERGPELVNLPRGASVTNARDTQRALAGGNTYHYNIYPAKAQFDADDLMRLTRRQALLASTGGAF